MTTLAPTLTTRFLPAVDQKLRDLLLVSAGAAYAFGPTGGYLLGFIVAAYVTGWLAERGLERNFSTSILPFLTGTLVIYALGAAWLSCYIGAAAAITHGILPFLPGDLVKRLLAALALPTAWKLTN